MLLRSLLMVTTVLFGLSGCASDNKKETLDASLRLYERSIRWGNFSDARLLTETPEALERLDPYQGIKVISYEVLRRETVGDFQQLNQTVEIKFYHEDDAKIRTLRDTQVWLYDEKRQTWVLQTGLPDFESALR
ncbi:MAG: hypothetical protein ACU843_00145 [Gammaproteobacteria bacterium]